MVLLDTVCMESTSLRRSARLAATGSVYVCRHGERSDVADSDWWLTADRPQDPPLTALGHRQAYAAGQALTGAQLECIYSSPFRRCVQTACEIADALEASGAGRLKIKIEPGLGEMLHHDWFDFPAPNAREGTPYDAHMSTAALVDAFGADRIDASYTAPVFETDGREKKPSSSSTHFAFPEEWHDGVARYVATLARLRETSPFSVLVTHGAGVQSCAESVPGVDMANTDIGYCCLTHLTRQGPYEWKCATVASHKHTEKLE